jgi:hypothetical protein
LGLQRAAHNCGRTNATQNDRGVRAIRFNDAVRRIGYRCCIKED